MTRQPGHTNPTDLRLGGGVASTSCTYASICAMVTLSWARARLHGHGHVRAHLYHGHTCTAMAMSQRRGFMPILGHAFDETSAAGSANQAPAGLLKLPATATTCSPPAASTHDAAPRRGVDAVGARVQAGPKAGACPRAWIPEESGQVGFNKSPQTRRRIAQDGWQITQARPGVMLEPGFAVSTSLLYHVFLEVSR